MKKIQSVVCDLDGSLLNHFKDVSPANQDLLVQLAGTGCLIGIASGRPAELILDNLKRWGLDEAISFVIASNGCTCINRVLDTRTDQGLLSFSDWKRLCQALAAYPVSCGVLYGNRLYFDTRTFWSGMYSMVMKKLPVFGNTSVLEQISFPKIYVTGSPAVLKKIAKEIQIDGLQLIPVGKYSLEAVAQGVSKFDSLLQICNDFSIPAANVLSFGDDYNDIDILNHTMGVALKNAPKAVVDAAHTVTKYAASQDGIAYHLNEMLLSKEYVFTGIERQDAQ